MTEPFYTPAAGDADQYNEHGDPIGGVDPGAAPLTLPTRQPNPEYPNPDGTFGINRQYTDQPDLCVNDTHPGHYYEVSPTCDRVWPEQ